MDPLTTKVASDIARSVARSAARPVGAKVRDYVLGAPEEAAISRALRAAIDAAVAPTGDRELDRDTVGHVLAMLEQLFQQQYFADAKAIDQPDRETALAYWHAAAEAAGWDLATFPLYFPWIVGRILDVLPEKLRIEAAKPDSPVTNYVVVSALRDLELSLTSVLYTGAAALTYLIPVSQPLRRTLDQAVRSARLADHAFVTPYVFLAILRAPDSLVPDILDLAHQGLAAEIGEILSRYVAQAKLGPFVELDWREREDVQAARLAALRHGAPVVSEAHLLIGILEAPSNTQRQLVAWFGAERTAAVKEAARSAQGAAVRLRTPGRIFPDHAEES